jgi:hypothetical protein
LARGFGAADLSAGVSFAWEQDVVGETDKTDVVASASAPVWSLANHPIRASGSLRRQEGGLAG